MQVLGGVGVGRAQQSADEEEAWAVISVVEAREGVRVPGAVGPAASTLSAPLSSTFATVSVPALPAAM